MTEPKNITLLLVPNDEEECWELLSHQSIETSEGREHELLARFYDGDMHQSPLGVLVKEYLESLNSPSLPPDSV